MNYNYSLKNKNDKNILNSFDLNNNSNNQALLASVIPLTFFNDQSYFNFKSFCEISPGLWKILAAASYNSAVTDRLFFFFFFSLNKCICHLTDKTLSQISW